MQGHIITRGFEPIDISGLEERDPAAGLHHQSFEMWTARVYGFEQRSESLGIRPARRQLLACAIQGLPKAFFIEWLQQIVQRVGVKRAQGVFVVSRRED